MDSRKAEIERKLAEAFAEAKRGQGLEPSRQTTFSQSISGSNNVALAGNINIVANLPHGPNLIPCPACRRPVSAMPGTQCPHCGCAVSEVLKAQRISQLNSRLGVLALGALAIMVIGANVHGTHWMPEVLRNLGDYMMFGGAALLFVCAKMMDTSGK